MEDKTRETKKNKLGWIGKRPSQVREETNHTHMSMSGGGLPRLRICTGRLRSTEASMMERSRRATRKKTQTKAVRAISVPMAVISIWAGRCLNWRTRCA